MKQTPEEKRIENNMEPGALSAGGFLGTDPRSLWTIIRDDALTVRQLGLTHQQIADQMTALTQIAQTGLGAPVKHGTLDLWVEEFRGRIFCPFRDKAAFGKRMTVCQHRDSGQQIRWSDLNIHMIEAHGFYEGQGSAFRVDPRTFAALCAPKKH